MYKSAIQVYFAPTRKIWPSCQLGSVVCFCHKGSAVSLDIWLYQCCFSMTRRPGGCLLDIIFRQSPEKYVNTTQLCCVQLCVSCGSCADRWPRHGFRGDRLEKRYSPHLFKRGPPCPQKSGNLCHLCWWHLMTLPICWPSGILKDRGGTIYAEGGGLFAIRTPQKLWSLAPRPPMTTRSRCRAHCRDSANRLRPFAKSRPLRGKALRFAASAWKVQLDLS